MGEYRFDNGRVYWRRTPGTHLWLEIGEATTPEEADAIETAHRKEQET
jgi:hypothetical protein